MTSPDGKTIYATCEHHKVHVPPRESIDELRQALKDEVERRGGGREWIDDAVAAKLKGRGMGSVFGVGGVASGSKL